MATSKVISGIALSINLKERDYLAKVAKTLDLHWVRHMITVNPCLLTLSKDKATTLRAALQNPITDEESELDQECRSAMWCELHNYLEVG